MNRDLIDRQAAIDAINQICPIDAEYDCTLLDRVDVRCVLTDLPSVLHDVSDTNVGDMISRQEAIDALDVLCQEHRYRIPGKRETYSQYNEAWQDALDRAENAIGNLPSAQPEIIHCRECKHAEHWYRDKARCFLWHENGIDVFEDGFCNYAERRIDD